MEQYTELYKGEKLKLYGQKEYIYGSIITIKIYLSDFSGLGMFYVNDDDLVTYLDKLDYMNKKLSGECIIKDNESTNYCHIYFEERNLYIDGSFTYNDETLKFKAIADQTVLEPIINLLKS